MVSVAATFTTHSHYRTRRKGRQVILRGNWEALRIRKNLYGTTYTYYVYDLRSRKALYTYTTCAVDNVYSPHTCRRSYSELNLLTRPTHIAPAYTFTAHLDTLYTYTNTYTKIFGKLIRPTLVRPRYVVTFKLSTPIYVFIYVYVFRIRSAVRSLTAATARLARTDARKPFDCFFNCIYV